MFAFLKIRNVFGSLQQKVICKRCRIQTFLSSFSINHTAFRSNDGTPPGANNLESICTDGWNPKKEEEVTSYVKASTGFLTAFLGRFLVHLLASVPIKTSRKKVDIVQAYEGKATIKETQIEMTKIVDTIFQTI